MSILETSRTNIQKTVTLNPERRAFFLPKPKIIDWEWKGRPYLYALSSIISILLGFFAVKSSIRYTPGETIYIYEEIHLDTPTPEATLTALPDMTPIPFDQSVKVTHINGTPVPKPTIQNVIKRSDGSEIIITFQPID